MFVLDRLALRGNIEFLRIRCLKKTAYDSYKDAHNESVCVVNPRGKEQLENSSDIVCLRKPKTLIPNESGFSQWECVSFTVSIVPNRIDIVSVPEKIQNL